MCLTVDKAKFKIETASDDIVVYKVLFKRDDTIISPYWGFIYELGKEYKTIEEIDKVPFYECYEVYEGFHSFLTLKDARNELKKLQEYDSCRYCCFRCIIPKGTHVVYGKYCAKDAIVSEAIKVVEEV